MDVVALDRELADPERVLEATVDECLAQDRAELEVAQPGDVAPDALGDVDREPRLGHLARHVRDPPSPRRCRRAAGALTSPTVGPKGQLLLACAPTHLELGIVYNNT